MPTRSSLITLILLLAAVSLTGCVYSREIAQTRRDLERHYPEADFDRQIIINLGPRSLHTFGWLAGLAPEDEAQMARDYLYEIDRVKVGIYQVDSMPDLDDFDPPSIRRFERDGWEVAVKAQEDDGVVWVLYRERYDQVRDIYAIVLSDEELVLARVKGHLNRLLEKVMDDHYRIHEFVDELEIGYR